MAEATENIVDSYRPSGGPHARLDMAAEKIPYGAMVMVNAAGFIANQTDTTGTFYAGVAIEDIDNSGGSAGDEKILVDIGGAIVKCEHEDGSLTIADVGVDVMAELNNEVTSAGTGTNDIVVGSLLEVLANGTTVWVKTNPF